MNVICDAAALHGIFASVNLMQVYKLVVNS